MGCALDKRIVTIEKFVLFPFQRCAQMRAAIPIHMDLTLFAHRKKTFAVYFDALGAVVFEFMGAEEFYHHENAAPVSAVSNACAKSASKSDSSSIPIEKRSIESEIPMLSRRSAPISWKIVCATGIASVRVSPKLLEDTTVSIAFKTSKQSTPGARSMLISEPKSQNNSR